MKRFRKSKKGFSLVELIIVIAIMVALIAVMAPAFVKYVKKSHDAVVTAAAESVLSFINSEIADGGLTVTDDNDGTVVVEGRTENGKRTIHVDLTDNIDYAPNDEVTSDHGHALFAEKCGADTNKTIKSDLRYVITIHTNLLTSGHPSLEMDEQHNDGN